MVLEKTLRMNSLFAFYRPLLTEKQQEYMKLYYANDYSLGEIADDYSVSRQAIYDNIKRSESILLDYENKLHLVEEFKEKQKGIDALTDYVKDKYSDDSDLMNLVKEVNLDLMREE